MERPDIQHYIQLGFRNLLRFFAVHAVLIYFVPQVTGFCRRTTFKLPTDPSVPVVMVGAGTGLAPLRGMYWHLDSLRQSGATLGANMLVFGCRCACLLHAICVVSCPCLFCHLGC